MAALRQKYVIQSSKSFKGSKCLFLFKRRWSMLIERLFIKVLSLLLLASRSNILKSILYKNSYSNDFVDKFMTFLDRVLTPKIVVSTVLKNDVMVIVSYLGKLSL